MNRSIASLLAAFLLTGTAGAADLNLTPCEVQLVDGRRIAGQLAYQDDSLAVVYSPGGGTLRSVSKAVVHAITVSGKRTPLNPKRELTAAEKELLGRIDWPDAAPAEGRKPAYTAEKWPAPKRLMIWKNPGRSGILHEPKNWIIVGGDGKPPWPATGSINPRDLKVSWLDTETDLLIPAAEKAYQVKYTVRPAGIIRCRHITVERNATLNPSTVPAMTGNLWVARGGAYHSRYTTTLAGDKQTFFLNDQPRLTPESPGAKPVRGGHIIPREGPYGMAQYLTVRKGQDASVEFIGTVTSSDDFQILSGMAIVAENAQLWPGTRSLQHIRPGTTLRLMSGSEYGKAHTAAGSGYGFKYNQGSMDVVIAGRIEAGTEAHPITEDVRFGISFKAPAGFKDLKRRLPGAVVAPGAEVVVHTADPDQAKLVICWHGRHNAWFEARLEGYKEMPEEIILGICGDVMLENVRFEDLAKGGLLLENPSVAEQWKNVTFGRRCRGDRGELIVKWPDSLRKPLVSDKWYRQEPADK